jgi:hypothetical protein
MNDYKLRDIQYMMCHVAKLAVIHATNAQTKYQVVDQR